LKKDLSVILSCFFDKLNEKKLQFLVLRNSENYPDLITGDIDLLVSNKDFIQVGKLLTSIFNSEGWDLYLQYKSRHVFYLSFFLKNNINNDRDIITFEFFDGFKWHGIKYLNSNIVLKNKVKVKNFYKPEDLFEQLNTLIFHILYSGALPDKYYSRVMHVFNLNEVLFREKLKNIVGLLAAYYLCKNLKEKNLNCNYLRYLIILRLVFIEFVKNPINFVYGLFTDICTHINRPPGIIVSINEKKISDSLLQELLNHFTKYHIFLPPYRYIVYKNNNNLMINVKKAINNGGVVFGYSFLRSLNMGKYIFYIDRNDEGISVVYKNRLIKKINSNDDLEKNIKKITCCMLAEYQAIK